jgi:hypothetical protein
MTSTILTASCGNIHDVIDSYQTDRRAVSDRMYALLHSLVILLTGCSICIAGAYAWDLGEGTPQSAILTATAVGIEVALVFFAAVMYPKPIMAIFGLVAGVGVLLISILTITSFLLSQQHQQEHADIKHREGYRAGLMADRAKLDISSSKDRGTIAILSNRIEEADKALLGMKSHVPETKSTAVYHYIAKTFGYQVEAVSLALRGFYGLIVVCTAVALAGYLETIYSPRSLGQWLRTYESQTKTINGAVERLSNIQVAAASRRLEIPVSASESIELAESADRHRRVAGAGEVPESLYSKVRESVSSMEAGAAVPVHQVRAITKRQGLAYGCIDKLMSDGVVRQETNGRYVRV